MFTDYKVEYRREETLRDIANAFLSAHGKSRDGGAFDITDFVQTTLKDFCTKKRKTDLQVDFFKLAHKYDEPANVTFRPHITLHVDETIWAKAKSGDEYFRYVIAHEVGHIVLHDHNAKAFSEDPSLRIRFADREYSAEWQADTFADHFLVPDEAVRRYPDESLLSMVCNVSLALARRRLNAYFGGHGLLVDRPCKCGNFSLVREASGVRCFTCGAHEQQ